MITPRRALPLSCDIYILCSKSKQDLDPGLAFTIFLSGEKFEIASSINDGDRSAEQEIYANRDSI